MLFLSASPGLHERKVAENERAVRLDGRELGQQLGQVRPVGELPLLVRLAVLTSHRVKRGQARGGGQDGDYLGD